VAKLVGVEWTRKPGPELPHTPPLEPRLRGANLGVNVPTMVATRGNRPTPTFVGKVNLFGTLLRVFLCGIKIAYLASERLLICEGTIVKCNPWPTILI
jgi:hypothetical protein